MDYKGLKVLITGGASFIGSHLTDALVQRGAKVSVVDDLSSGKLENIKEHIDKIVFQQGNLLDPGVTAKAMEGIEVVFHLAADHGGRGYVDLHQVECSRNMILDGIVFKAAYEAGVDKVCFASSGCVYPVSTQSNPDEVIYLTEDMVKPPYDADKMYGYAKLMAELTLKEYAKAGMMKSAICRFFTVYGPRGVENHAVIAMIAKAFIGQNPFEVWGDGRQIRNWTHVSDIVEGMILAAEKIDDGTPVNLGTMERIRVIDAVEEVLRHTGHKAELKFLPSMPTGPLNRVADNRRARQLLGYEPKVKFIDGLHQTIDWYYTNKDEEEVRRRLPALLLER